MKRSAAGILLAAVMSTVAGSALPGSSPVAPPVGPHDAAEAPTVQAGVSTPIMAGLPTWGVGAVGAELAPRDSGLRPPARTSHASTGQMTAGTYAVGSRARAVTAEHADHTHVMGALRRNAPVTLGNPPPASRS